MVSSSSGSSVRGSMTSALMPSASSAVAASSALWTSMPLATTVTSSPGRTMLAEPSGTVHYGSSGTSPLRP